MSNIKTIKHSAGKYVLLAVGMLLTCKNIYAEPFADDFSSPSIRFYTNTFDNSSGVSSVDVFDTALRISSTGVGESPGNINLHMSEVTDSFRATFALSSESVLELGDSYSGSSVFVEGYFYNDTYSEEQRAGQNYSEGDVWVSLVMGVDQNGSINANYCLSRRDSAGQRVNLGDSGTEFCDRIDESSALQLDTTYDASIQLDRSTSVLTINIGEIEKQLSLVGSNLYEPIQKNQRFQVWQNGVPGTAVAYVYGIGTDSFYQDFAVDKPILDRYYRFENHENRTVTQADGTLVLTARGVEGDSEGSTISVKGDDGYLEAEITMLSDSTLGLEDGGNNAYLQYFLYNDIQDGGVDGRLGDVRAQLYASKRSDGRSFIEYCLRRSEDADDNERSGLLPESRNCDNFPVLFDYDTAYRVSIELDRESSLVRFRVDQHVVEVPVFSNMFIASDPQARLGVDARNASYVIATFDDVRNHPEAVTSSEQSNGLVMAPLFPAPVDPATLQVDSTLPNLYDILDYSAEVNFVDDFNFDSHQLGLNTGRDRGQAGVSWSDGAIVLESNSFPENDDGNWSEFYINHQTDSLETVVSLSSDSRLPPDNDAEAQIQIRAVFYNDTQDNGFNEQEGDMEAVISIRISGDGRRQIRLDLRRRDENGRTQDDLLNDLEEVRRGIESIVPTLDTEYKIGIALDRENSLLRYSVNEDVFEYAIPTGIYLPARLRTLVSVNHRGSSGIAVGKVYSIKTDRMDESYRLVAPLIAPYSPQWNAFYPGRSVEIEDGRLRLAADGTLTSGRDPGIDSLRPSDYIGADLELSSESRVEVDGQVHVELHSIMYNDLVGGEQEGSNEGRVFSTLRLVLEGTGNPYVEYCMFRSNTSDFSETTPLIGANPEECPRFLIEPSLDTAYQASLKLDRTLSTLTFKFDDEMFTYDISTDIGTTRPFIGAKARTSDGSSVVAWVDNLAFSENPQPLDDSPDALISNNEDVSISSSGCSVASGGAFDPLMPALGFLALTYLGFARRRV